MKLNIISTAKLLANLVAWEIIKLTSYYQEANAF